MTAVLWLVALQAVLSTTWHQRLHACLPTPSSLPPSPPARPAAIGAVSPDLWVHAAAYDPQPGPVAVRCQPAPPGFYYCTPTDGALSWGMIRVSAPYAWGHGVVGRPNTRVCIVDSGVDCGHPDLRLPGGHSVCAEGVRYWDGVETLGVEAAADEAGHGTKVAGAVAAAGDGVGTAGVMIGGAALYVCRFMDAAGWGRASDALRCLNWCLSRNAAVSGAPAGGSGVGGVAQLQAAACCAMLPAPLSRVAVMCPNLPTAPASLAAQ